MNTLRFVNCFVTILFYCLVNICFAQNPGDIDLSFNPTDNGLGSGIGVTNPIRAMALQSDGKVLIGGDFTSYNGTSVQYLARLNDNGIIDNSFNVSTGANNLVRAIAVQPDGKVLVGGDFNLYKGSSKMGIVRLNSNGTIDNTFSIGTGTNFGVEAIAIQSDGKILIGGIFTSFNGTARNRIVRLNSNGSIDNSFDPGDGANQSVQCIKIQDDGKILIGGQFTHYNNSQVNHITRLNSNGSKDNSFVSTGANSFVKTIDLQTDGKILVGGSFSTFNGESKQFINRLNSNGSNDNTFNIGSGFDNVVNSMVVLSDGQVIVGGNFTSYKGVAVNRIVKLTSTGSKSSIFNIGDGSDGFIYCIVPQSDGKILLAGDFSSLDNNEWKSVARLNSDGSIDGTFNAQTGGNASILSMKTQSDGKVVIVGNFTSYNGVKANRIVRINPDGSVDNTFNTGTGADNTIYDVAFQSDGKIIAVGEFFIFNGLSKKRIVRLNTDGSIDNTFATGDGADFTIYALAIQSDDKILIGGNFTTYNLTTRNRIARLNSTGTIDNSFSVGSGANNHVYDIVIQPDGKILLCGKFTFCVSKAINHIARLNIGGDIDNTFNVGVTAFDNDTYVIDLQSDGKILVGGTFTQYSGNSYKNIVRINTNGSIDLTFAIGIGPNYNVKTIVSQPDDKILIGGNFTSYDGTSVTRLTRLNIDGSLDNTFDSGLGANNIIENITLISDQYFLAGGNFTSYDGIGRNFLTKVYYSDGCPKFGSLNTVSCGDYTSPSGKIFTVSGNYKDTIPTYDLKCDSIISIELEVVPTGNSFFINSSNLSGELCEGDQLDLSVDVDFGDGFEWRRVGDLTVLSSSSNLTLSNILLSEAGSYYVKVLSSTCGDKSSDTLDFIVNSIPNLPLVNNNEFYCEATTASVLVANAESNHTLNWWGTNATGGVPTGTAPTPSTSIPGVSTYYVSQYNDINMCESGRSEIVVTVQANPNPPSTITPINYCINESASILTATAETNHTLNWWGTDAVGGVSSPSAPTPLTNSIGSTTYYVSQTDDINSCESNRAAIEVVVDNPTIPTVSSPVNYCQNDVAVKLTASGTFLKWYTVPTGGVSSSIAPTPSTSVIGNTSYYVSSSFGSCESARSEIVVSVYEKPAKPLVSTPDIYCKNVSASALSANALSNHTLYWWGKNATGGTYSTVATIPSTITVGQSSYYVSQINDLTSCQSDREFIVVKINAKPSLPSVSSPITYCQNDVASELTATALSSHTLNWWGTDAVGGSSSSTAPTPLTNLVNSTTYYVSQTNDVTTCESDRAIIVVDVNNTPSPPAVSTPVAYCQNASASVLSATGSSLKWYTVSSGGIGSSSAPTPSTSVVGNASYYVSSSIGSCESTRSEIVVQINSLPTAPLVTSPISYCQNETASSLSATAIDQWHGLKWWGTNASGGTFTTVATIPSTSIVGVSSYFVSQVNAFTSCESDRAYIEVSIIALPNIPVVVTPVNYCQNQSVSALIATAETNHTLNWWGQDAVGGTSSLVAPFPSSAVAGTYTYYVSQVDDATSCESLRESIEVVISSAIGLVTINNSNPSGNICEGEQLDLSVDGSLGSSFEWKKIGDNSILSSATNYSISNFESSNAGSYYVKVLGNVCGDLYSDTLAYIFNTIPDLPIVKDELYCKGFSTSPLQAIADVGHTLNWWGQDAVDGTSSTIAPTPSSLVAGTFTYYVSQINDNSSCESNRKVLWVFITDVNPPVSFNEEYCLNDLTSPLNAEADPGFSVLWYGTDPNGFSSNVAPTPESNSVGITTYYVAQKHNTSSCESSKLAITVKVNAIPSIPTIKDTLVCLNALGVVLPVLPSNDHILMWYGEEASGGTPSSIRLVPNTSEVGTTTYYVGQKEILTGCASERAPIVVNVHNDGCFNKSIELVKVGAEIVNIGSRYTYEVYVNDDTYDISKLSYNWFYSGTAIGWDSISPSVQNIYYYNDATEGDLYCVIKGFSDEPDTIKWEIKLVENNYYDFLKPLNCPTVKVKNVETYIDEVSFLNTNFANIGSGKSHSGYGDYTALFTDPPLYYWGETMYLEIVSKSDVNADNYFGVFIDFNNNGSFGDEGDFVDYSDGRLEGAYTSSLIKLPDTASFEGTFVCRIRLMVSPNEAIDMNDTCITSNFKGEVEDYIIRIDYNNKLKASNLLTPNNDTKNDVFVVHGLVPGELNRLAVFSRSGKLVYLKEAYDNSWQGTDMDNLPLPEGTYYYVMITDDNKVKGFVEIIRD